MLHARVRNAVRATCLALLAAGVLAAPAQATDFTVTKATDDNGACTPADCSLREAVIAANAAAPGPNKVILPARHYMLTISGSGLLSGDVDVTRSLTIAGAGAATTIIDASGDDRLFHLAPGAALTFTGVTLTGGQAPSGGYGSAILADSGTGDIAISKSVVTGNHSGNGSGGRGGAIRMEGGTPALTISDSTISSNSAGGAGSGDSGYGGVLDGLGSGPVKIERSTVTGNRAGGSNSFGYGGVLSVSSPVSITDSVVSDNHAGGGGTSGFGYGGVFYGGGITVTRTALRDNTAGGQDIGYGGALDASGAVTLTSVTATGNHAGGGPGGSAFGYGGAIKNDGPTTSVERSTLTGNRAGGGGSVGYGGAIDGNGDLTLTGSTVSGNTVGGGGGGPSSNGYGGGVNTGTATITNATLTGNVAGGGGSAGFGGAIRGSTSSGSVKVLYTTVAGNSAVALGGSGVGGGISAGATAKSSIVSGNVNATSANCDTPLVSQGHNLEHGSSTCGFSDPTDAHGDPKLGPLANNGGPTQTLALLPGSAAIDAGADNGCPGADQRGVFRPLDGNADGSTHCDIGAFERSALPAAVTGAAVPGIVDATLTGKVNPGGGAASFHFDYGKTTAYGKSTAPQPVAPGVQPVAVSSAIAGLKPKTRYHYRLVVTNEAGAATGADLSFKTKKDPFKGVGLRKQSVVVAKGIAFVKVSCPKGVPPQCSGTLTLRNKKRARLGRGKFVIQPGTSMRVRVKLTKKARKLLGKKKSLLTLATAKATDGAGTKKTRSAKVKLKRKKKK